jgi:CRISPR-associated protein Csm1
LLPEKFNKGEWGIGDSFINLTAKHHKPETVMEWIVAISDRISSGFDRKDFEDYNNEISVKDYKRTRLLTLFEGIEKENDDNLNNFKYRYALKELSPQNVFPIQIDGDSESDPSEEYRQLFFNFVNSLEKLEHKDNVSLWLDHFDSLFCIYASYIPAATVGRVVLLPESQDTFFG